MKIGRIKRRWTLGGLMILIAATSVPLVLIREHIQRCRLKQELDAFLVAAERQVREHPELYAEGTFRSTVQNIEYFEYGSNIEEPSK
jgi:hypothetical protein